MANLDVVEHVHLGLRARGEAFAVDRFDLEAVVSTLHRGVVVTTALGAHACDQSVVLQQLAFRLLLRHLDHLGMR